MKTKLLSVLAFILLTTGSFASERTTFISAPTGVWIKLSINFHRPKFNCERGFGVCLLFSAGYEDNSGGTVEKNLLTVRGKVNDRNQLVVEIEESALSKYERGSTVPYFRNKTRISILDPYTIPDPTCHTLGLKSPQTIKPGNYPVSFQNGIYTIVFQL